MKFPKGPAALAAFAVAFLWGSSVLAQDDDEEDALGQTIAQVHCSGCHATGRKGPSPMAQAPPFRTLAKRYPLDHLAEALAEGIVTGHPGMPEFTFEPDAISALLDYIGSISEKN